MKLERIRIEQLRQFRESLEIGDLEPGINVFTGPNEAGKSTIVAAIRAAFFERHRSASVDDLRPWGDSTASPTIELNFSIGTQSYRLRKSFLARRRCELTIGTRQLDGAEAEEHLAELLGFQHAGKGASKAEHWGIPGLLWIQQGAAQELRESVAHATDHLRSALNETLGEVASSGGDEVLAAIEEARNELLTAATARPRGIYAEAIALADRLALDSEAAERQIADYREKVDTLAVLRREQASDQATRPWQGFREQERAAAQQLEAVQRIEDSCAAERLRAAQCAERLDLLRAQLEHFAAQQRACESRRADLERAREQLAEATALVEQWSARRIEADASVESARLTLRAARAADTRRGLVSQAAELALKLAQLRDRLSRAQAEQARVLELQALAASSQLATDDLKALREQQLQQRELAIRQSVAATHLRFELLAGQNIRVGGETVSGTEQRMLLETTTLELPGLGQLEITPGGADLSELRARGEQLADRHAALLQRIGLASLEAAEARALDHARHLADLQSALAALKALAPQGIDAVCGELASVEARAREVELALAALPETGEPASPLGVTQAEAAEASALQSQVRIRESLHAAQLAAGTCQGALASASRELDAARTQLEAPDHKERVAKANRELLDARAEQSALALRIEALDKQLLEARPEILRQDIERLRRSAEQLERQFGERRDAIMRLEVELESLGAQGLDERLAELGRDLAQARRRLAELHRRAHALDHLLNRLRDKRRALTCRLQAPLQAHLNRYLQLLFPRARLEIDDNLSLDTLVRENAGGLESGEFEALSFGAREQMGVISRLAYADLLRDAGRPTLIILDDALVHSDEARLAQMKRVLFDAATRHQILLFSCHPENWRDLGVRARSLRSITQAI